ncbi:hypothetical protein [Streptomyces sp. Ag109_O5-1]|nr:hypothetical protein [Streptomyces sp. Ag109_O5-1]
MLNARPTPAPNGPIDTSMPTLMPPERVLSASRPAPPLPGSDGRWGG